jgi:transposase InsO family protein
MVEQGCWFTSAEFTQLQLTLDMNLSMDRKRRALDNIFVERLCER